MSKKLYEEALADAKQLRMVAEDNAKRALVEAVTPRIRDLIERELLKESGIDDFEDYDDIVDDQPRKTGIDDALLDGDVGSAMSVPDDEGKVTLDLDAVASDPAGSEVEEPVFGVNPLGDEDEDQYELSAESVAVLAPLVASGNKSTIIEGNVRKLGELIERFSQASNIVKSSGGFSRKIAQMISQVENTYEHVQEAVTDPAKKNEFEQKLEAYFQELNKLQEHRMSKRRKMNEGDVTLKLTGLPDDLDLDSVGVDLITGEEGEEGDLDVGGDEELDFDLEGGDEGGDESGDEDLDFDVQEEADELSDDTVVEIDEGMLRREIARMKRIRETSFPPQKPKLSGPAGFDSFGDGHDEGEPLDVKLTTEADGETDELCDDDAVDAKKSTSPRGATQEARRLSFEKRLQERLQARKAKLQREARAAIASKDAYAASMIKKEHALVSTRITESMARAARLKRNIAESTAQRSKSTNAPARQPAESLAEATNLRNKLAETNLFNAKLVYTNKLLQNESLSKKQKAEIIERLDEAKNIREVKLVYDSLTKTLSGTSKPLSESRVQLGSSSRPATSSGATQLNEGYETNRWAKLAGIK